MKQESPEDAPSSFETETSRFREILVKGRSANQVALFDLLVERSMDERSPKEVEIALALFGNDTGLDANAESGVRVYVHRLRKRIDEHYSGKTGTRLVIPKGEYRIVLEEISEPEQRRGVFRRFLGLLTANPALSTGLTLILCAGLGFASWQIWYMPKSQAPGFARDRQALFGSTSGASGQLIAVGDTMLLAETEDQRSIHRMIRNPTIQTREDFGRFLTAHPETFYQLYDFNLKFAPLAAVETAWNVQDELTSSGGGKPPSAVMVPVSSLGPETLQSSDVIYVGRLSQLGLLKQYVFAQSNLQLSAYNRIVDNTNGKTFEGQVYTEAQSEPKLDYGYLTVRTLPTGRRLIVFAGLGDRGTAAMADLLKAPRELAALKKRLGGARHFEAVFEVQTLAGHPTRRRLAVLHEMP